MGTSREIWPNFFIVGAPRSGTTSLYEYLKSVPGIYMSPLKEPHYFGPDLATRYDMRVVKGKNVGLLMNNKAAYLKLFRDAKDSVAAGEASASYLSDRTAPTRIRDVVPEARIIAILRDPAKRAYSHYLMHVREGIQRRSFGETMRAPCYVEPGFYGEQVTRYLEAFGAGKMKILIFEEFIQDTSAAVREVLQFLGVNGEPQVSTAEAHNALALPRSSLARVILGSNLARHAAHSLIPAPLRRMARTRFLLRKSAVAPMGEEERHFLEQLYREDVKRLREILGRSLPWVVASEEWGGNRAG